MRESPLTVREYDDARDRPTLVRMMEGLQDHLVAVDALRRTIRTEVYGASYAERTVAKLQAFEGVAFVAELDGRPVGFIAGTVHRQTAEDRMESVPSVDGRVEELYVDPAVRSHGVGRQLMDAVERSFRSKGCTVVRIEVLADNAVARRFYEGCGYSERVVDTLKLL